MTFPCFKALIGTMRGISDVEKNVSEVLVVKWVLSSLPLTLNSSRTFILEMYKLAQSFHENFHCPNSLQLRSFWKLSSLSKLGCPLMWTVPSTSEELFNNSFSAHKKKIEAVSTKRLQSLICLRQFWNILGFINFRFYLF